MTRRAAAPVLLLAVLLAGLLAPLALAGPAAAGSGVGCTGSTCSVLLSNVIALKGDFGATGTTQVPLAVPPPPCLWQSIGDTATGSRYIIQNFGFVAPSTPFGVFKSVQQARGFLKDHPVPPASGGSCRSTRPRPPPRRRCAGRSRCSPGPHPALRRLSRRCRWPRWPLTPTTT